MRRNAQFKPEPLARQAGCDRRRREVWRRTFEATVNKRFFVRFIQKLKRELAGSSQPKDVTMRKVRMLFLLRRCPSCKGPYDAAAMHLRDLKLTIKQRIFYLFDFGDQWWHEITVESVDGPVESNDYPMVLDQRGDSPPPG